LARHPITDKYLDAVTKTVKVRSILEDRCVRCHAEGVGGSASNFPLDSYERILDYCQPEEVGGGMSITKLAETTHVHLLGFAVLYGLTGLAFACTSYPGWLRIVLGPWPLLAQLADISCWWLARWDPAFATAIRLTGLIVAVGLAAQILLTLLNMFGRTGRLIVVLLLALTIGAGFYANVHLIQPYLTRELLAPAQ
jgi:hypothetical protein